MAANPSIQLGTDGNWAIKENNLLAYKKDGTRFFNKEFDFTRATSATRVNKQSLIETVAIDKPRIDFLNNTKGHLLLEPSRTNKMPTSEDFNSADFYRSDLTITSDDAISPYGTSTADKIAFTGNGSLRTENTFTFTDAYTYSIFVKKGNSRYVTLRSFAFTTSAIIGFDLDSVTAQTGGVIEQYPNDWFRLSISKDVSSDADKNGYFYLYLPNSLGSTTTVSGNYAYIFGNQIEEGSYATSYIPTAGSTATRNADVCNNSGSAQDFNSTEGVLYAEIAALTDVDGDASLRFITLSNGTSSKRITIYYFSSETFGVQLKNDGYELTDLYIGGSVDRTQFNKIALYYSGSNVKAYLNGIEVFTNSSWVPFSANTINTLTFTGGALSDSPFYGNVKSVAVFKRALTDAELQELTT